MTLGLSRAAQLNGNRLNGTLPASVADLSGLLTLDLSSNELSGYLPTLPDSLDEGLRDPGLCWTAQKAASISTDGNEFWCPFPVGAKGHAIFNASVDCTCETNHYCPNGFDEASYYADPEGSRRDGCEYSCDICDAGRYSNRTWKDGCALCRPGSYNPGYTFADSSIVDECTPCAPAFASALGATACDACAAGTFAADSGRPRASRARSARTGSARRSRRARRAVQRRDRAAAVHRVRGGHGDQRDGRDRVRPCDVGAYAP